MMNARLLTGRQRAAHLFLRPKKLAWKGQSVSLITMLMELSMAGGALGTDTMSAADFSACVRDQIPLLYMIYSIAYQELHLE